MTTPLELYPVQDVSNHSAEAVLDSGKTYNNKDPVNIAVIPDGQQPGATGRDTDVQRVLLVRHIQLIAISGAIGAGVFISIGSPLTAGGPLGLIIGLAIWCSVIFAFSNCVVEVCTLLPMPGGYLHYAGRFLDPSARFAAGWNYILGNTSFVCFELTAMHIIVQYWHPDLNPAIVITCGLIGLIAANGISARIYGEVEFWISILKVILMLALFLFTFITMVGGNPIRDRYGFRYWKTPGVFAGETAVERLQGVWSGVTWGAFAVAGPDFLSVVSAETKHPRRILPRAFRSTIFRVVFFYMGSALAVSINCPYDSPQLLGAIASGAPGAAASPYVINIERLQIKGFAAVVNAIVFTSVFSTGSSFMFTATRGLHMLACEGQAPRIFSRVNRYGTPYFAVLAIAACSCLAYLSVSSKAAVVLDWFTSLTTACTLCTWIVIGVSYLRFRAGIKYQNMEHILPVRGWLQPWSGWYSTILAIITLIFSGSYLFPKGAFDVPDFLFSYLGVFIWIIAFSFWKIKGLINGTQRGLGIPVDKMDFVSDIAEMEEMTIRDEHEYEAMGKPTTVLGKIDRVLF